MNRLATLAVPITVISVYATPAHAEGSASLGLDLHLLSELDLADAADVDEDEGFGRKNDLAAATMGVPRLTLAFLPAPEVEIGVNGSFGIGGIDAAKIGDRYEDDEGENRSKTVFDLGLHLWALPSLSDSVRLVAGVSGGWQGMMATSDVTNATVYSLEVGPDLGLRYHLHKAKHLTGGLQVLLHNRARKVLMVEVKGDETDFDSSNPRGWYNAAGASLAYFIQWGGEYEEDPNPLAVDEEEPRERKKKDKKEKKRKKKDKDSEDEEDQPKDLEDPFAF